MVHLDDLCQCLQVFEYLREKDVHAYLIPAAKVESSPCKIARHSYTNFNRVGPNGAL